MSEELNLDLIRSLFSLTITQHSYFFIVNTNIPHCDQWVALPLAASSAFGGWCSVGRRGASAPPMSPHLALVSIASRKELTSFSLAETRWVPYLPSIPDDTERAMKAGHGIMKL